MWCSFTLLCSAQCAIRLSHHHAELGPSFERTYLLAFQERARHILSQLRAHARAGLFAHSPFFAGEVVKIYLTLPASSLSTAATTSSSSASASSATELVEVTAVFVCADVNMRSMYVALHPQLGLAWAFAGNDVDLDDLAVVRIRALFIPNPRCSLFHAC
jgi:hypothetical protein